MNPIQYIGDEDVKFVFSRSSGPGGQNVNKVNTQATAILDLNVCRCLSEGQKTILRFKLANRIDSEGKLQITGSRFRSQQANRDDVIERLNRLIASALVKPKPRKPTKVPYSARQRRLEGKKIRSAVKKKRTGRIGLEE
ncbi:MAG: aminoacyl-tRNA hydrolase [Syntrophus sp. (in: bacteria)]|nr:aminoacyl-tRNA hydrolase [Syntrophus sp. (in: bacteria)]